MKPHIKHHTALTIRVVQLCSWRNLSMNLKASLICRKF